MVAHYFHTVGIGRFEYGARFHPDDVERRARSHKAPREGATPFVGTTLSWDRLTVGREFLALVIVVRIHGPGPRGGAPRLVLGVLLQSTAARFDPEAPYNSADLW